MENTIKWPDRIKGKTKKLGDGGDGDDDGDGGISATDEEIRWSSSQAMSMAGMVAAGCSPPPMSEDCGVQYPLAL
ncbi:hypothetical protein TIFTF001_017650 [Ficus carica]|uniref:Uncharacterized protein n=1 Tax=Ficus carica TaxID=3494 RepID=A0AA88D764_FICCA|nr:hypothetical protein TIFTF001_017650 [Ficus carica]